MSYKRIKCPKGHVFHANVHSKNQRIVCPHCAVLDPTPGPAPQNAFFNIADCNPADVFQSPPTDDFKSGGGGDFGGGGASDSY